MRMVSATVNVGGNAYNPGAGNRPLLSFPCKDITNIDDVSVWCSGGYSARVVSHIKGLCRIACYNTTNAAGIADHAVHLHTITTTAVGGGDAMTVKNAALEDAGGGHANITGVQNAAAMAHAQVAPASGGLELNANNNAFDIYGTAIGFV
jgi:hypothetical protein